MIGLAAFIFAIFSLLELALLIQLGGMIGAMFTVMLCLATGVVGIAIAKWQGVGVLRRFSMTMSQQILPAQEMADGVLLFAAAALLFAPGLLTDALGFALLIPDIRTRVRLLFLRRLMSKHGPSVMGYQHVNVPEDFVDRQSAKPPRIIDIH